MINFFIHELDRTNIELEEIIFYGLNTSPNFKLAKYNFL